MILRSISIALLLGLCNVCARGEPQAAATSAPDQKAAAEQAFAKLPWAVKLGLRSMQVMQAFPLVDRVVLVPDAATYVDEISKWSPQGRWPVLIEDDRYAPMFVRRFQPAQLIRRESVGGELPQDGAARQKLLESVVIRTYGGDPMRQSIRDVFVQQKYAPPGIVMTSVSDPAWTAAVALAAGHGEPLEWLEGNFGGPNSGIDDEAARKLIAAVDDLVVRQRYSFDKLGDEIDAITICRVMACKAEVKLPPIAQAAVPAPHNAGPVAITDLLGRHEDGSRYACTGWIFGDEKRCAYMAMCALFLQRDQALLVNTFPSNGGWENYAMNGAADTLQRSGFAVRQFDGAQADADSWQRMLPGGVSADVVLMNTKGNDDYFDMSSGRGLAYDVPVLDQPVALHLIHSWSMDAPESLSTIGARWLDHGAYAAVGSCYEPLLGAFVPPSSLANRYVNLVPFLIAARWWDGEPGIFQPWRVVTIGDPLMMCPPPAQVSQKRVAKVADYGLELGEHVKSLMRQAPDDGSGKSFAQAIAILDMLGKDEIAADLWRLADSRGKGAVASRPALGPLFRKRDVEGFLKAWDQLPAQDGLAQDMLWHLCWPRVETGSADREVVLRLAAAVRQPSPQVDIERLAPYMVRLIGNLAVRDLIDREIKKATSGNVKQALLTLSSKY